MSAPPLTGQSDWYLFESIKKYKTSVRGSGAGDPNGPLMKVMAGTLPDDNAILDVIAHIQSLDQ
jgi:cytochrome c oxidase subunit 2